MKYFKALSKGRTLILSKNSNLILIKEGARRKKRFSVWADFAKNPKYYWGAFKWEEYTPNPDEIKAIEEVVKNHNKPVQDDEVEFYRQYTHCYKNATPWGEFTATSENTTKAEAEAYLKSLGLDSLEENRWYQLPNGWLEREIDEDRGFFLRVCL